MGSGQRLHSTRTVVDCLTTLERLVDGFRPRKYVHLPTLDVTGASWTGPGPAPNAVVSFDDARDEFAVAALWTVDDGTEIALLPLGSGDDRLLELSWISLWRSLDPSLTVTGIVPGGRLTLRAPSIDPDFVADTVVLAGAPVTPRNLQIVGHKLAEMVLLKAMQFINGMEPRAAVPFAQAHGYLGGNVEAHLQRIVDDLAAWNAGVLPYMQGIATRCRAVLLDALASDPRTLPLER